MQHVELAVGIQTTLVVFIQTLIRIFDTGKIGNASIDSLQEVQHRQIGVVESRDVVVIEGQVGCTTGNLFTILDELFHPSDPWERRGHGTNTPGSDLLRMSSQVTTRFDAGTAYVYNHFEAGGSCLDPSLGQPFPFLLGQHVAFAR